MSPSPYQPLGKRLLQLLLPRRALPLLLPLSLPLLLKMMTLTLWVFYRGYKEVH